MKYDPAVMNDPYDQTDKLMVYVDSDHRGCADSFRSTTGMVIMLNGGPVMWKSRIQGSNSTSTAESEVRALAYATAQVKWFKVFMDELGWPALSGVRPRSGKREMRERESGVGLALSVRL